MAYLHQRASAASEGEPPRPRAETAAAAQCGEGGAAGRAQRAAGREEEREISDGQVRLASDGAYTEATQGRDTKTHSSSAVGRSWTHGQTNFL